VYDAGGKLVAEYSTETATTPKINYTTNDHLGSPRITTDEKGAVISRTDYQPYGEEIASTQRTADLGYTVQDTVKQGFTGYFKDDETGLDYAQARMYKKELGRFTSPDIPLIDQNPENPESWNLYVYVRNNPIKYVDPTGTVIEVKVETDKALDWLLGTLPVEVRDKIVLDKDRKIDKNIINSIESDDPNFVALREMVNSSELTEITTAQGAVLPEIGYTPFSYETVDQQIQATVQSNNAARIANGQPPMTQQETQSFIASMKTQITRSAYFLGQTYSAKESPTGNRRIVVSDGTGQASSTSRGQLSVTMGHELYLHGHLNFLGKPWEHTDWGPNDALYEQQRKIETRTLKNVIGPGYQRCCIRNQKRGFSF
jgi:RHS repeat-associated protein